MWWTLIDDDCRLLAESGPQSPVYLRESDDREEGLTLCFRLFIYNTNVQIKIKVLQVNIRLVSTETPRSVRRFF